MQSLNINDDQNKIFCISWGYNVHLLMVFNESFIRNDSHRLRFYKLPDYKQLALG